MKLIPPAGEAEGAPYVDGNRSAGIKGSIVPAKAIEHPMREIVHVIDFFGLTPSESDTEQLRKAIEAAIAAATGGGDTSQFLLVSQARARLPIFPEIQSAGSRMNVTSPSAGTVQVPSAVSIQHRGIYPFSTSSYDEEDRTFATLANKTYHLRWTPVGGFALKDLADSGYNPTALAESNYTFDSTYDDMLIARVVTSAGNVATITNLANAGTLRFNFSDAATPFLMDAPNFAYAAEYLATLNWARTPFVAWNSNVYGGSPNAAYTHGGSNRVYEESATRYAAVHKVFSDFSGSVTNLVSSARALMLA